MLCRLLIADGWQVTGTTRKSASASALEALGVEPVIVDVFDADALRSAVVHASPIAIVHQLTDLPQQQNSPDFKDALVRNARLREIGTRNLVDAGVAAGVRDIVAQSVSFFYAPGPKPFTEESPLNLNATDPSRVRSVRAVQELERLVLGGPFRGVVLRYGQLYGPGTWTSEPPADGPVHVDAAAHAARLALRQGDAGIYNIAEPDGTVSVTKAFEQLGWNPNFRT